MNSASDQPLERDLIITAVETNSHHGVGIFLQRLFPDSTNFVCIRTTSLYQGEETFGSSHHELCSRFLTVKDTEEHLRRILTLYRIRRILCVPYYREEFIHAVLAKRITGAPLCTYLMDDQNVYHSAVPDHWVADLLAASDLRLAISPEMVEAYTDKYRQPIELLPPVLNQAALLTPCYWQPEPGEMLRVAMVGNVWTNSGFAQLRELARSIPFEIDWYGKGAQASWLSGDPEAWEKDHIHCMGFYPEEDLIASLASYPFILIPSGQLDATDDNQSFSRLSLPSRLIFLHASTDAPVLLLGSPETAAGKFISRLQTGLCARPGDFMSQVERLLEPSFRARLQANIRRAAPSLILKKGGRWLWDSLELGAVAEAPFQTIFPAPAPAVLARTDGPRWRSRPARSLPEPGEYFASRFAASFGFLRNAHLSLLAQSGTALPAAAEIELSHLSAAVSRYILTGSLPSGGDVLFLGNPVPATLLSLPEQFRIWSVHDLPAWRRNGYSGDPVFLRNARTGELHPNHFPQFSAITSIAWCGELGDSVHDHEGLSLYLEACTRPGGMNFHLFNAVSHPAYFWVGAAHAYLKKRFLPAADWPDLDELLSSDDCFVMGQQPYDRHWRAATGKSYQEFGRPLALSLHWQRPDAG